MSWSVSGQHKRSQRPRIVQLTRHSFRGLSNVPSLNPERFRYGRGIDSKVERKPKTTRKRKDSKFVKETTHDLRQNLNNRKQIHTFTPIEMPAKWL